MSLILYPDDYYDAFVSITDCDLILQNNVIGNQRVFYNDLSESDKEIYIRQSTTLIKQKITLPLTLEQDLKKATAYLVNFSIGKNMTNDDGESNVKVKDIVGIISTEYFSKYGQSNDFPDIVMSLLSSYRTVSKNSFLFERS